MTNFKSRLAGLLLVVSTLLAVLAFTSTAAQAAETQQETCYEQVAYVEYQFKRTETTPAVEEVSHEEYLYSKEVRTETFKTEFKYAKYTQTRIAVNQWDDNGPWGEWSAWTAWGTNKSGGGYVNGWGPPAGEILEGPAPHGNGRGLPEAPVGYYWQRQYRYQKVGERQVSTGYTTETVSSGWVKEPLGSPWVLVDQRTIIDVPGAEEFTTVYYYTGDAVGSPYAVNAIWTRENPGKPWEQYDERSGYDQVEVDCPPVTTVPPTTVPPTTEPPVTTVPPTTQPPVDTTVPPTVATSVPPVPTVPTVPPAPPTELPATGTNNGLLALIAAGMLAIGGLLIAASRRQQVN